MKKRIALALAMAICLSLLCTVALADKVTLFLKYLLNIKQMQI